MEEYKIKNQMANLTTEQKKMFIKGLIKNAKNTKTINNLAYGLKVTAYPMAICGGAMAALGLTAIGAGILNIPAEVQEVRMMLMLSGVMGIASGMAAMVCASPHCKDAKQEIQKAKTLSACAKKDIKMLKEMYKEIENSEKYNQQEGMEQWDILN